MKFRNTKCHFFHKTKNVEFYFKFKKDPCQLLGLSSFDPNEPKAAVFIRDKDPVVLEKTLTLTNLRNFIKEQIQIAKNRKVTTPSEPIPKSFKDEL